MSTSNTSCHTGRRLPLRFAVCALVPLAFAAAAFAAQAQQSIPSTPGSIWNNPAAGKLSKTEEHPLTAPRAFEEGKTYTLPELIDIAENRNPETRIAWERAKQQALAVGIARAKLFPLLAANVLAQRNRQRVLFGDTYYRQDLTATAPAIEISYTLLDFGERQAAIQAEQAKLTAVDLAFNDTHRKIIFAVTAAYYRLISARGEVVAAEANLANASAITEAVEARLQNGLATLPDSLEARAARAQADYELETVRGLERLARGQLAEALGIEPVIEIPVSDISEIPFPDKLEEPVEQAIRRALDQRPDLLAEAARVQQSEAGIRGARSQYFPKITFRGNTDYQFLWGSQLNVTPASVQGQTWIAQLSAKWTIFDGGERRNELERALSERRGAEAELTKKRDETAVEVWSAYSNVQTALRRQRSADALLSAASRSYESVNDAYRYGVKNFLDVVSAQRTLAGARTAVVQARADLLTNLAQLAFETGDLTALKTANHKP